MRSMFNRNLKTSGKPFTVKRTSEQMIGIFAFNEPSPFISVGLESDIRSGDWILNSIGESFFVSKIEPLNEYKNCYYVSEYEYNKNNQSNPVFNINADKIENSIIGTQTTASITFNQQIEQMRSDIQNSSSSEKEELLQIVSMLENISNNQEPVPKGFLSKFSAVMQRNSWITSSISSFLLNIFLNL